MGRVDAFSVGVLGLRQESESEWDGEQGHWTEHRSKGAMAGLGTVIIFAGHILYIVCLYHSLAF